MRKQGLFRRIEKFVEKFAHTRWYPLVVASLAAADSFLVFIPTEALLVAAVLARPKRWFRIAWVIALGSSLGAILLAYLSGRFGTAFIKVIFPSLLHSGTWTKSIHWIRRYGAWGLAIMSLSPFPQHAGVAIAGLARLSPVKVFTGVFAGRILKYSLISWCSVYAPDVLRKVGILPKKQHRKKEKKAA